MLGISETTLSERGGIYTAREIEQQPALWKEIADNISNEIDALTPFLQTAVGNAQQIILTGAGTSAFIGLSLRRAFSSMSNLHTAAIATTDIISHPKDYFASDKTILLVSFARSGNSPESIGVVTLADEICKKCFHLIITCSETGELANYETNSPKYVYRLPQQANDKSLAMTSSYSGMLLAGLLMARHKTHTQSLHQVDLLCAYGRKTLQEDAPVLRKIADVPFTRAVFLGSGPLFGVANESHLKLQELTDGEVICKYDTFLGFRHGPKAVVNEETLMIYLHSNVSHASRYEIDLLHSMSKGRPPMLEIAISESPITEFLGKYNFTFTNNGQSLEEEFLSICMVLPSQILAFYKSLSLGLSPDAPSKSGAISRVVQGVSIYPF